MELFNKKNLFWYFFPQFCLICVWAISTYSIIITGLFLSHPYKVLSTTFKLQRENERIKFIFSLSPFCYSRYILFRHTIFFCLPLPPYFRLPPSLTPCVSLFYIISINFLSKWCELTALLIKRMKGKTSKLIWTTTRIFVRNLNSLILSRCSNA